jgi:hypothetical protein
VQGCSSIAIGDAALAVLEVEEVDTGDAGANATSASRRQLT